MIVGERRQIALIALTGSLALHLLDRDLSLYPRRAAPNQLIEREHPRAVALECDRFLVPA
jgi:hypothetical protein